MKKGILTTALVTVACLVPNAKADYRNGNSWMATSSQAQRALVKYERLYSDETGGRYKHVTFAKCNGDRTGDYPINRGRGYYHHLYCGVVTVGGYVFRLDYWATGANAWNFRVSDISYVS